MNPPKKHPHEKLLKYVLIPILLIFLLAATIDRLFFGSVPTRPLGVLPAPQEIKKGTN